MLTDRDISQIINDGSIKDINNWEEMRRKRREKNGEFDTGSSNSTTADMLKEAFERQKFEF